MTNRRGPVRHARHTPSHSVGRAAAIAVAAVAGFALASMQAIAMYVSGAIDTRNADPLVTTTPDAPENEGNQRPLNILLIGSDARTGDNAAIAKDGARGMRSDATVLAHLSADRTRIDLVSIPRDLQVDIPDCTLFDGTVIPGGYGDFNVAFANGGRQGDPAEAAACTINAVHEITDVRIDHWAVVDFSGFETMIDALGGVPMCVPERIVSVDANLDLQPGLQTLRGADALGWARLRTAEVGDVSGSDLQRISRQQDLLEQTMRTAMEKNLFSDAGALTSFLRAGAESLTTDEQLGSLDFMISLAYGIRGLSVDDLVFTAVPWEYTEDRLNVLLTDDAPQMFDDLRHDRELSVVAEDDATSAWGDDADSDTTGAASPAPDPTPRGTPDTIDDISATCGP